jgi:hypothetical protein
VIVGINLGPQGSIQNFLGAADPQLRRELMIRVVIDLLVLLAGIVLLAIDLVRRRRRGE